MRYHIEKYNKHEVFYNPSKENMKDFMNQLNDDGLTQDKIDFIEILVVTNHPVVDNLNQDGWGIDKWLSRMKKAFEHKDIIDM